MRKYNVTFCSSHWLESDAIDRNIPIREQFFVKRATIIAENAVQMLYKLDPKCTMYVIDCDAEEIGDKA